jgi:hypothetical protein
MLLSGCAAKPDVISFDRGAFALMYADVAWPLRQACEAGRLSAAECTQLGVADALARKAIVTPATTTDRTDEIMGIFLKVGAAAARAYGFPVPSPSSMPKPGSMAPAPGPAVKPALYDVLTPPGANLDWLLRHGWQ